MTERRTDTDPMNPEAQAADSYFAHVVAELTAQIEQSKPHKAGVGLETAMTPSAAFVAMQAHVTNLQPAFYDTVQKVHKRITCKCGHYDDVDGKALSLEPSLAGIVTSNSHSIAVSFAQQSGRDTIRVSYLIKHAGAEHSPQSALDIVVSQFDSHQATFTLLRESLTPVQEIAILESIVAMTEGAEGSSSDAS
jgi:hypothetical protein